MARTSLSGENLHRIWQRLLGSPDGRHAGSMQEDIEAAQPLKLRCGPNSALHHVQLTDGAQDFPSLVTSQ